MPEGSELTAGSIRDIPLYDGDVEAEAGIPAPVRELREAIAAADGLILATPEYNNSIPGVFKNAIDWLSRPPANIQRIFGGKPVALTGASPGRFRPFSAKALGYPFCARLVPTLVREPTLGISCARSLRPSRDSDRRGPERSPP